MNADAEAPAPDSTKSIATVLLGAFFCPLFLESFNRLLFGFLFLVPWL